MLASIVFTVLFYLLAVSAVVLALMARANHHVRQALPESERRDSLLAWNFWTGGVAASGGAIRAALTPSRGMDERSMELQRWVRWSMAWGGGVGLLSALVPRAYSGFAGLLNLLSGVAVLYLLFALQRDQREKEPNVAEAARKTLFSYLAAVPVGVLAVVAFLFFQQPLVAGALALVAGLLGIRAFVRATQLGLLLAILIQGEDEPEDSPTGGRDTLHAVVFLVVVVVLLVVVGLSRGIA